jgi:hypothetical protein
MKSMFGFLLNEMLKVSNLVVVETDSRKSRKGRKRTQPAPYLL